MSRSFSDTTNLHGLMQRYEKAIGVRYGYVSSNQDRRREFASYTRTAWDTYLQLAFRSSGTWQYDDSNHEDFPFIKTNLVDGQRDYTFVTDKNGNLILDIYKVAVLPSATATLFEEIYPVDQQTKEKAYDLTAENTAEGTPFQYDKTANGILLDPIPSYNATKGLKAYINREASYFTESDTTKMPGCPGIHHDYFFLRPAMEYARDHNLTVYDRLAQQVLEYEGDDVRGLTGKIERYFAYREKDVKKQITMKPINYI